MWIRKTLECPNQSLLGHSGWSLEEQNADRNLDSKDSVLEVSEGARTPLEIRVETIPVIFWQESLSTSCLFPRHG